MVRLEVLQPLSQLDEIFLRLRLLRAREHLHDAGRQEGEQDGDDRDHHQQLDQREAGSRVPPSVDHVRSSEFRGD